VACVEVEVALVVAALALAIGALLRLLAMTAPAAPIDTRATETDTIVIKWLRVFAAACAGSAAVTCGAIV
jgi:hypothetical protein